MDIAPSAAAPETAFDPQTSTPEPATDPLRLPIHAVFAGIARRHPDRMALVSRNESLSYRRLDARSDAIASALRRRGVKRGDRIGLYAQRSAQTIATILGILKAGAAYVPFDPSYPPALLRYLYEDSAPSLVLLQSTHQEAWGQTRFPAGESLDLEALASDEAAAVQLPEVQADDPAYVMYTSGSTGRPKGVVVPHRGVVRLVIDNPYARFGPEEVFLQLAPLSFDASTFEIWGALLHGASLAIVEEPHPSLDDIVEAIGRYRASTLWLTAGLFQLMIDHRLEGLKPLRQLLAGGDVLSPAHVDRALRALPDCRIINGYGPTENTTFTCCYQVPRERSAGEPLPIGLPIAHTSVHILDEQMRPVAAGEEGELYAGGAGVAIGYLNRPELTADRFIPDPFSTDPSARLYKTGDRVRRRTDGNIEFRGRADRQVKINGKRVELDEIENCLRRSGGIGDCAVISVEAAGGERRLAAFVAPAAGMSAAAISIDGLAGFLRSELPDYMQPSVLTALQQLPLSPTGKIDRARLALILQTEGTQPLPPAPDNELQARLLQIWREALAVKTIAIDDDFFALGGSSLQLLKVHAILYPAIASDLTLADLFRHTTIRTLAAHLEQASRAMQRPGSLPLTPITSIDRPVSMPEYYHASVGSNRFTLEPAREVVLVVRGQSTLGASQWQHALDGASRANPGARLRMIGKRRAARWRSDGVPPRLRMLEQCDWDTRSERGVEFIAAMPLSLTAGPSVELIVGRQSDGRSLLILRALHAVFDGSGAVHFLKELFRVLREEAPLGSNAGFSDVDLMLSLGGAAVKSARSKPCWLTGECSGEQTGDEFRRIPLGKSRRSLLAEVAIAMANFAYQHSDRPVLIAVPIDLRRHLPGLLSTANFSSMLRIPVERGDTAEAFRGRLHERLVHNRETAYPRLVDYFRALPLPWLDLLLSRTRWNYRNRQPLETAVVSDMGGVDSAALSCPGFAIQDLVTLPLAGSAFATLTGIDDRIEMMINLPRVLGSSHRLDAFAAHMRSLAAGLGSGDQAQHAAVHPG